MTELFKRTHKRVPSEHTIFKELTRKDAEQAMANELRRLLQTIPTAQRPRIQKQLDAFQVLFKRYLDEPLGQINWEKINILADNQLKHYASLPTPVDPTVIRNLLNQLVVVKLNGGLGTTMGCTGPKSIISVRNEFTFLDLNVQQIERLNNTYGSDVPLVLMNSFNTEEDTEKVLRKYQQVNVKIYTFVQSMYPRVNRESLLPVTHRVYSNSGSGEQGGAGLDKSDEGWYPPGHGDIYRSLVDAGFVDQFLQQGKKWLFISNIDNMGATIDLNILSFLELSQTTEFVMEVTEKTRADVKGGTLVEYENKLRLLEIAQVPKEHVDEFTSVRKFKIFNTNNLWVSLPAIQRVVAEGTLHMEIIVNPKTLDNGVNVIQLEEAAGAAIKSFDGAAGIVVPRHRFLPVKTTSDFLLVMSNLYQLSGGSLSMSPLRSFPSVPLVKLGPHFRRVKDFLSRFSSIPDCLELDHLTVSGDVTFGKGVSIKGTVIIIANHGDRIDIPAGSVLENKIVSGNLRILDH